MKLKWHKRTNPRCSGFFASKHDGAAGLFGDRNSYNNNEFWARDYKGNERDHTYSNNAIKFLESQDNQAVLLIKFPAAYIHFSSRDDK